MTPAERAREPKRARLLPCKGGAALLIPTIERSQDDDYIVIALSAEDHKIAEYTHCATPEQAATVLVRYHKMPEVAEAFVLHRFGADFDIRRKILEMIP